MTINPKISIVIVNWNSGIFLFKCLESIVKNDNLHIDKIVVVDNSSSDDSLKLLDNIISNKINILKLDYNAGFAAACNAGSNHVDSEYLLFLNPDAKITENSISLPLEFLAQEKNKKIGICGISLYENDNKAISCSRFPSLRLLFFESIGLSKIIKSIGRPMKDFNHNYDQEVDQVIGAFYIVRRKLFEDLKKFDETFFVYYEEVDFALRAKQAGYRTYFMSKPKALHYGGGTSENVKSLRLFYNLRSRTLFFKKHNNFFSYFLVLLITFFIEPFTRCIFSLRKLNFKEIPEILSGYKLLYVWFFLNKE